MEDNIDKLKNIPLEDLNSIKLIKNTRGYQWEIKIFDKNEHLILNKIKSLDFDLKEAFCKQ